MDPVQLIKFLALHYRSNKGGSVCTVHYWRLFNHLYIGDQTMNRLRTDQTRTLLQLPKRSPANSRRCTAKHRPTNLKKVASTDVY